MYYVYMHINDDVTCFIAKLEFFHKYTCVTFDILLLFVWHIQYLPRILTAAIHTLILPL